MNSIKPEEDGITHINIYSKGATKLGRDLSNFSSHRVRTMDGLFASLEGYWYWLGLMGKEKEQLRGLAGWEAKRVGRELKLLGSVKRADFKLRVAAAMIDKVICHQEIYYELAASKLPFKHYYVYGGKVVEPEGFEWIMELWELIRKIA